MSKTTHRLPTSAKITKQFLKHLYETKCVSSEVTPVLQILAFEESLHQHSEIMQMGFYFRIRLSDGVVFIDCSLVGSYSLNAGKIVSADVGPNQVQFYPKDLVKLTDFFSKIDSRRICELRVMVLKMELAQRCDMRIGVPAQLRQFFQNKKQAKAQPNQKQNLKALNNQSVLSPGDNKPTFIKIQEDPKDLMIDENDKRVKDEPNHQSINLPSKTNQIVLNANQVQKPHYSEKGLPLTFQEIIDGKEGYFIGRLLRMKMANKETKDGPMSVLYLGFVDRSGQLVRVNMAGRLALKEEKELKKGKCYFIKDLQTYQTQKMPHPQIRLKDKEYRILQVQQPNVTETFAKSYFHWDHENDHIESDNVDIIGIIDEIEDKTSYPHSNEKRQVVRVVVRNKFKTVKINFWAEQIKVIVALKLKKRDAIVLEDIKKKKNIFLDYQYESSILKLDDVPTLKQSLKDLLPQSLQAYSQPKNIHQLQQVYDEQSNINKVLYFRLFLSRIQQNRIIYKLCSYCKEKVQKSAQTCMKCQKNEFYFKFNCQLQFADYSGTLCCVAFQFSAQKIFGKSALEINEMEKDEVLNFIDSFTFQEYDIGLENKNGKLVIRSAQPMESAKQYVRSIKANLCQIRKILNKNRSG